MNIKEYIESGILEAYVLGALSEEERAAVVANIAQYPELAAEVQEIERAMYQYAEANAVTPPAGMQEDIWAAIQPNSPVIARPSIPTNPKAIHLPVTVPERRTSWVRAAVWVALAGSLLTNVLLMNNQRRSGEEMQAMKDEMLKNNSKQQQLSARLDMYDRQRAMLMDANMQPVIMRSAQAGKKMMGMAMYNKTKGETYVSLMDMPMPPQGKQYQLWVIQDGKPVDMGVLSSDMIASGAMQKVPMSIQNGQAFAISLEKEGGNPTPTEVMVVGEIKP
ncbi:anti-sigma factor [Polluticoccus soli]|uniref:anti-sigma factor n=1 Tax=Polluticoccus soli TaxID=3034150 RepID=UPI0023E2DDB2|nr:anti-sigma factor [Flavipsychrobacter sp. JY13-12]